MLSPDFVSAVPDASAALPPVRISGAWLRHERAGIARSPTSDWDIAVRDAGAAGRELEAAAGVPDLRVEHQYVVLRYYPWGEVDMLPTFEWNGIEYLEKERFWSRVVTGDDGLLRPCLAHDAIVCWMSQVLSGGTYREKYDPLLEAAWAQDGPEFRACLESAFGRSWADLLGRWLDQGIPGEAAGVAGALRKALSFRALRVAPGETIWRQARHWWTELRLHWRPPFPWVAVLGPDGSGKSSVIDGVRRMLAARRLGVEMLHWRPQTFWKSPEAPGGIVTNPHGKPPRGLWVSSLKLMALGAEWWIAHLGRLRHIRAKRAILLSDRYFADLLADPRRYRYGGPRSWARRAFRCFPQPDRVILLLADAATIYSRKQEVEFAELERQLAAYRELAAELGERALIVDAGKPLDAVVRDVCEEVLLTCRQRTKPLPDARAGNVPPLLPAPVAAAGPTAPPERVVPERKGLSLRVLVSAYACSPSRGAEANVAWNLVRELSQRHDVWVLTRENNRAAIESSKAGWVAEVHWEYLDPPRGLTFWRQGQHGLYPFYIWWQLLARSRARALMKRMRFDVAHHVTFGTYLVPSPLADLGVPLVFGPVGGGEKTPPGLTRGYRLRGRWEEGVRNLGHHLVERSRLLRHWYHAAAWTLAATPVTAETLSAMGVQRLSLLPQSAFGDDEVERYIRDHSGNGMKARGRSGPLHLVTASRLVHWKAIDLALEAVAEARARGVDVTLTVLQEGPERPRLIRMARRLGLADVVAFPGRLPGLRDVFEVMAGADGLLHPALHEAFGQACLEALALGIPVICLDWGGPGMIVEEGCGYKVKPHDPGQTVLALAEAIASLAADVSSGRDFKTPCQARAASFRWSDFAGEIEAIYRSVSGDGEARRAGR